MADVPFIAVVREVAPVKGVAEDHGEKGLGVGDYQYKYFDGNKVYLDKEWGFVKAMGNRKLSFGKMFKTPLWKFWAVWGEIKDGMKKMSAKGVEGNLLGDGMTQGGVLVIGPGSQGVVYAHFEENKPEVGMPDDDIVKAVESMSF